MGFQGYDTNQAGQEMDKISEARSSKKEHRVDSTSDERTVNNVMRHEYKVLTEHEKNLMKRVKDMGRDFHDYMDQVGTSRELSLAKTRIEEAVMWAVKHITK